MLYSKNASDPYKTSVIDTMVAEIQSVPGEDQRVLLLGYKDQMEEMFQVMLSPVCVRIELDTVLPRTSILDLLDDSRSRTPSTLRTLRNPSS